MAVTENLYTGDNSTVLFSFTFPYLQESDVKVSLDGTLTTAYSLANATTVQFNTAPASGVAIRIFRDTANETPRAAFYSGSVIRAQDLNNNFDQVLYVTQESDNEAATATSIANAATATANTALSNSTSAVATANTAETNSLAAISTANTAESNSTAAVATANTAASDAASAVTTANSAAADATTAISTANGAVTTANSAAADAATAISTANSAATDAATAISTANTADTNASTAVTTANTALSTANTALTNSAAAVTTANSADSKADQAIAAVANALLFTIVANVAAIPSSPSDGDAIEITDSTGIESFTPLSGTPAGFVGDSGLGVRLVYDGTGATWVWLQYFPQDPEARYGDAITVLEADVSTLQSDVLGLDTNKVAKAGDTMTGALGVTAGSAASPSVFISGDTNTGIYSPGADQLALSTNGTGRLFVDSNGNVRIGTAVNSGKIQLPRGGFIGFSNAADTANSEYVYANAGALEFGSNASSRLIVTSTGQLSHIGGGSALSPAVGFNGSAPSNSLVIDSTGRLGIGTGSPAQNLHIASTSTTIQQISRTGLADGNASDAAVIEFANGTGAVSEIRVGGDGDTQFNVRALSTDSYTNSLFIKGSTGNVGIGTTTPNNLLTVNSNTSNTAVTIQSSDSGIAAVVFGDQSDFSRGRIIYDNSSDALTFETNNLNERARIDSSGRLLVGTSTSPSAVAGFGSNAIQVVNQSAYAGIVNLSTSNDAFGPHFSFGKSRGGTSTIVQNNDNLGSIRWGAADGTDVDTAAALIEAYVDGTPGANDMPGRLVFSTTADGASSPTPRMTIDSSGNVGIGRDPTFTLDIYKASGPSTIYNESGSISNTEGVAIYARDGGRSRQAAIGVYKHSGITSSAAFLELEAQDGVNNFLWVDDSNQLRISTIATHIGTTSGTVVGTQTSDERLKNILGPVEYGLDTIKQIEPVRYALKSEPDTEKLGFIAQQVLPIVPQSVFDTGEEIAEGEPTKLGMEYAALIPVLINAIKELSAKNDALEARVAALESA